MDFATIMRDYNGLARGNVLINLPSTASLRETNRLLEEQHHGLVGLLVEMSEDDLADLDNGLKQAVVGLTAAMKKFHALGKLGERLKESGEPEFPKIGETVTKIENAYAEAGNAFKHLLLAVRGARTVEKD